MSTQVGPNVRLSTAELLEQKTNELGRSIEFWDRETLEDFTLEVLKRSVDQALRSNFYKEKFANLDPPVDTFAKFEQLPFTWPEEAKNRLADLLACPREELLQINMSSGTTGGPTTYVAYTAEDLNGDGAYYAPGGLFAFAPTDLVFVALPYDMATVGLSIHRDVQRQGATVLPAGKGGTYSSPERLVQAIHDLEPTTLFSTPSYAYYLHGLYNETFPEDPRSIRHLHVGGEGASPALRERLGTLWGGEVRQWYGSTEIGPIAYACELGHYHVTAGNAYMEIVDSEGETVRSGEVGRVVLTTLGRVATPMVRYLTGDLGSILDEPCPCGRTLSRFRMLGRATDQIRTDEGAVSPYLVEQLFLETVPGAEPWYHLALRDEGTALVAERPRIRGPELSSAEARLRERVKRASSLEFAAVEWTEPGTLDRPWTKMRRVKDERTTA